MITSAATLVEVIHPRINRPALGWTLSRLVIAPVTEPIARHAAALLADVGLHGLHGHKHTVDAMLSVRAERRHGGSACCAFMSPSRGAGP